MAVIGYIRVSTIDQNSDLQRNALTSANCDRIFEDRMSGKVASRPGLKRALKCVNSGDTLVVWKLDRLGRSVKNLIALISELHERGAHFRSLTDSIDTSTAMGRFFFHVMSALAEMERELIVERTLAGLTQAHAYHVSAAKDELPRSWFVNASLIDQCPNLLCISSGGAGFDTVDVAASHVRVLLW